MRSQTLASVVLVVAFSMITPAYALAAATATVVPLSGHPSLSVTIAGKGFGVGEAVDVYVDTVDTMLLVSTGTGTFTGSVKIPASAQPGKHYLTAIGRARGDAAQVTFSVTTPWPEMGFGSAHLNWNPYENTLNTGNVASLGTLWQIPSNGLGGAPTVAANRVFVSMASGIEAVNATTGLTLWKALPNSSFYTSPAVIGTTLFVGDAAKSAMYALNATTGALIWSQVTGSGFESSPVWAGGLVYAGCLDGKIYAFAATTGRIVWTYATGGFIDSTPAVVNGVLYVGSSDHSLYALNASTGTLIWSYATGDEVESSPAVSNGVVYFGSDDDNLYAVKAAGSNIGSALWSYKTGSSVYSGPAIANNVVYFSSADGYVYAANAHSGALQWSAGTGGIAENLVVANGVVYVTSRSDSLFAIDAAYGEILATAVTGFSFLGNTTVSDGVLYLSAFDNSTYAFSLLAGTNAIRAHARPPALSLLHRDTSLVASH